MFSSFRGDEKNKGEKEKKRRKKNESSREGWSRRLGGSSECLPFGKK